MNAPEKYALLTVVALLVGVFMIWVNGQATAKTGVIHGFRILTLGGLIIATCVALYGLGCLTGSVL